MVPPRVTEAVALLAGCDVVDAVALDVFGFAGQRCGRVTTADGAVLFVKWVPDRIVPPAGLASRSQPEEALFREAHNLAVAAKVVPTARLVGFDGDACVLAASWLSGPPVSFDVPAMLADVGAVLDQIERVPVAHTADHTTMARPGLSGAKDVGLVMSLFGDRTTLLADCAQAAAELVCDAVGHGDPHPGNWMFHDGQLCLVDFDHLGATPLGWDRVFFAAHVAHPGPLAPDLLAAWVLERMVAETAFVCAGALAFRCARAVAVSSNPARRAFAAVHLPRALSLYGALNHLAC